MPRRLVSIFLMTLGCGDAVASSPDAAPDAALDAREADAGAECEGVYVTEVIGQALDEDSEGVEGAGAQACLNTTDGRWLCLSPRDSAADGRFRIPLGIDNRCLERLAMRVAADGRVSDYCSPPISAGVVDVGVMSIPTPAMEWEIDGAHLTHASGLVLRARSEEEALRLSESVSAIERQETESCKRVNLGFEAAVGFTPEGFQRDLFLERIPASTFEEGASVEIVLVGGLFGELPDGEILDEGDGLVLALGTVTGGHVDVDVRLPFLTWLGIRTPR